MSTNYKRFWPEPQGTEAEVVVPMTDFSVIDADEYILPQDARDVLKIRVAELREQLLKRGFAKGNKMSSLLKLLHDEADAENIPLQLHRGPVLLDHFRVILNLPKTPAIKAGNPQDPEELFDIISTRHMGGNASNILRSEIHMARAGVGARLHKVFSPPDHTLDPWIENQLDEVGEHFVFHRLDAIESRYGAAFPFDDTEKDSTGEEQRFSTNTPQASTIEAMAPFVRELKDCDFVVVSEGLGEILKTNRIAIPQLFNPTSALHIESALEVLKRCKQGTSNDGVFVNDTEMDLWIRVMENRQGMGKMDELPDAKFPSPFRRTPEGPAKIDENAIPIINRSHQRWLHLVRPPNRDHMTCHTGIGCGSLGGQYQFQQQGKYYIGCADTPTTDGASQIIKAFGNGDGQVNIQTEDVVGAGDAAFVATILGMLHTPLEDIFLQRELSLTNDQLKIAIAAFHSILGRIFGELAYRSKNRDLTGIPPESFPRILDTVVDKAIAAAEKITIVEKTPQRTYTDKDWGMNFAMWELEP